MITKPIVPHFVEHRILPNQLKAKAMHIYIYIHTHTHTHTHTHMYIQICHVNFFSMTSQHLKDHELSCTKQRPHQLSTRVKKT